MGVERVEMGLIQPLQKHVQSARVMAAIFQKGEMWWLRSHWSPETARELLRREMDGKVKPRRCKGDVSSWVLKRKGNPKYSWTLVAKRWSSDKASEGEMG